MDVPDDYYVFPQDPAIASVLKMAVPDQIGTVDPTAIEIYVIDHTAFDPKYGNPATWEEFDPTDDGWMGDDNGTGVCTKFAYGEQSANGQPLQTVEYSVPGATRSIAYHNSFWCSDFQSAILSSTIGPAVGVTLETGGHIFVVTVDAPHNSFMDAAPYTESQMRADMSRVDPFFLSLNLRAQ